MAKRQRLVLVVVGVLSSLGAAYRTPAGNFLVEAPTAEVAQQVGQWAEYYRKEKAIEWLGREMPPWSEPCPLHVKVNLGGAGAQLLLTSCTARFGKQCKLKAVSSVC